MYKPVVGHATPIPSGYSPTYPPAVGVTLRDWFAATATEEDVLSALGRVKKEQVVRELPDGRREVVLQAPSNSRQIARYLHADAMLEARSK